MKDTATTVMRPFRDLLDFPFVFSQRPLLTATEFARECQRRGFDLREEQLEPLHQVGALVPMFAVLRDWRLFSWFRTNRTAWPVQGIPVHGNGHLIDELRRARDSGRLREPRLQRFRSWRQQARRIEGARVWNRAHRYSPYQLLLIPHLRDYIPYLHARRGRDDWSWIEFHPRLPRDLQERARVDRLRNDWHVLILSATEHQYAPLVSQHVTLPAHTDWDTLAAAWKAFSATELLHWLGVEPEVPRQVAEELLSSAHWFDPLRDWSDLVSTVSAERRDDLRGDALVALDYRVAAELLLRFHEDLAKDGVAEALPKMPWRDWHPLKYRLRTDDLDHDDLLVRYGISPEPSLILVLEGATERLLMPMVFETVEMPLTRTFIEIFDAQGVNANLDSLLRYALVPTLGDEISGGRILRRPPTRMLVVFDPEGPYRTAEQQEQKRQGWVERLRELTRSRYGVEIDDADLNWLVSAATWGPPGASFEFAHFTDGEIANAVLSIGRTPVGATERDQLIHEIHDARVAERGLRRILHQHGGVNKTDLAMALWPLLQARIIDAQEHGDPESVPILRAVLLARDLALEVGRSTSMVRVRGP